jgi:hypothetical protein
MTQKPRRADDLAADLRADLAESAGSPASPPQVTAAAAAATDAVGSLPVPHPVLAFSVETDLQLWPIGWSRPGINLGWDGLVVKAGPIRFGIGLRRRPGLGR